MTAPLDTDAWAEADPCACAICGRDACEDHIPVDDLPPRPNGRDHDANPGRQSPASKRAASPIGLDEDALTDAVIVVKEGQKIARDGIPYLIEDVIPAYGMLGMHVGFTKTGKTTFAQKLGAAVAMGEPFLGKTTKQARVLAIAAEDPAEYTAWMARHLKVKRGRMTFYRRGVILDPKGLTRIVATIKAGGYGFVLIASWQAVVRGLMRDENDNAASVRIVEDVKAAARDTGVPWLIDAHSGKGEDQSDDGDSSRAMRGASAAAGAADFTLWLRYGNGTFGTKRRVSGKGRFVALAPMTIDFDPATGEYTSIGDTTAAMNETTWALIQQMGALTTTPQSVDAIARAIGLISKKGKVTGHGRRQVHNALHKREGVIKSTEVRRGQDTILYRLAAPPV